MNTNVLKFVLTTWRNAGEEFYSDGLSSDHINSMAVYVEYPACLSNRYGAKDK